MIQGERLALHRGYEQEGGPGEDSSTSLPEPEAPEGGTICTDEKPSAPYVSGDGQR